MAKPNSIELPDGTHVKFCMRTDPCWPLTNLGWILAPESWDKTSPHLHRELMLSVQAREFWATSRNLRYVRFIHRLDADTSGAVLMAKIPAS